MGGELPIQILLSPQRCGENIATASIDSEDGVTANLNMDLLPCMFHQRRHQSLRSMPCLIMRALRCGPRHRQE
jgi:hypothetical protein